MRRGSRPLPATAQSSSSRSTPRYSERTGLSLQEVTDSLHHSTSMIGDARTIEPTPARARRTANDNHLVTRGPLANACPREERRRRLVACPRRGMGSDPPQDQGDASEDETSAHE